MAVLKRSAADFLPPKLSLTSPSRWLAVACAIFALALGLFTEWQFAPFTKDDSFAYFLLHVHALKPITLLMIAIGAAIAFWVPFRRIANGARKTSGTTP